MYLETERLQLEPITMDDVGLLLDLDADPEVMRYLTGGRPTPLDEMIETVQASLGHRWIARERSQREFVGWFSLRPTSEGEAELGYRLKKQAWGKGYASEGSRQLIDFGFSNQDLHRIWAQTMTVNAPSRRVMDACGMRYVKTFHLDWPDTIEGTELGDVEYEILRTDEVVNPGPA